MRCYYCGVPFAHLFRDEQTRDHLTPRCRGGTSEAGNVVNACARCNGEKGPLTEAEYRALRHDKAELRREVRRVSIVIQERTGSWCHPSHEWRTLAVAMEAATTNP